LKASFCYALTLSLKEETITWFYILSTSNTPLHIAALLGHAEFAMVVMQCCPQFATELHELGVTPIHLASAEGQCEVVRQMLVRQPES